MLAGRARVAGDPHPGVPLAEDARAVPRWHRVLRMCRAADGPRLGSCGGPVPPRRRSGSRASPALSSVRGVGPRMRNISASPPVSAAGSILFSMPPTRGVSLVVFQPLWTTRPMPAKPAQSHEHYKPQSDGRSRPNVVPRAPLDHTCRPQHQDLAAGDHQPGIHCGDCPPREPQ